MRLAIWPTKWLSSHFGRTRHASSFSFDDLGDSFVAWLPRTSRHPLNQNSTREIFVSSASVLTTNFWNHLLRESFSMEVMINENLFWISRLKKVLFSAELYIDANKECYNALQYQRFGFLDLMKLMFSSKWRQALARVSVLFEWILVLFYFCCC